MSTAQETAAGPVFSYTLASADLRYIEIGERDIFLREKPAGGKYLRGEIAGVGEDSYINLSEILLEYAMSCEGCSRPELSTEMVTHFGSHLGEVLSEDILRDQQLETAGERLRAGITGILVSMDAQFEEDFQPASIEYTLDCCPLSECARDTGLNRSVEMAYTSLTNLLNTLTGKLASDWHLVHPSSIEINIPMHRVLLTR
jgi:hypothetical protein